MPVVRPGRMAGQVTGAGDRRVRVISFGYRHGGIPPGAHLVVSLADHFRNPHVQPELRERTGRDPAVMRAVLDTPGVVELVDGAAAVVRAMLASPLPGPEVGGGVRLRGRPAPVGGGR